MISGDYLKTVELIKEFLTDNNIGIEKFYMFGSRAKGAETELSDYDFMVVVKNDLTNAEKRVMTADIYRYLIKNNKLILMDLIIKTFKRFKAECDETGYLSNTVLNEGIEL